jgi:hypothetical protein
MRQQQQQQQQQAQSSAAVGALVTTAPSTHAMMGPYGSSSNVGMMGGMGYGGGMYGAGSGMYGGGMNSMYGGMGMVGGSMGMGALGMHNGASIMPANTAAAAVGPDGRPIAPVAKLQGWAIFAELASRLVQVIMHMARSGHEVFSVVAGSYWAFTSIRAMLGLGGAAPMHPMLQQQQQQQQAGLVAKSGAAAGVAGAAAKINGRTNITTPAAVTSAASPAAAAAPSSGRRTALFFGLFMVVATMVEFLYRRHQEKKKQQELEALRRQHQRLLTNTASGGTTTENATTASDGNATSSLPSTRCVAIHDFAGEGDGQMAFRCGDQLEVKEFDPKGWCFAASTGIAREDPGVGAEDDGAATRARTTTIVSGWVPGNFLRPLIQHRKL